MQLESRVNNLSWRRYIALLSEVLFKVFSLITIAILFVPFSPLMPAADIDSSWKIAINQAVAQGLVFGKDVVLTFGPLAALYSHSYHPAIDHLVMWVSAYLTACYFVSFVVLTRGVSWYWSMAYLMALMALHYIFGYFFYMIDGVFFTVPMVAALGLYKLLQKESGPVKRTSILILYTFVSFSALGLLPLVKGSLIIICGLIAVACVVFSWLSQQRLVSVSCIVAPLLSMLFFWYLFGQSVLALPAYFMHIGQEVRGYSMALSAGDHHKLWLIALYVTSAITLISLVYRHAITTQTKVFLLFVFGVFLLLSFKEGFVRLDPHVLGLGVALFYGALLLPFIFKLYWRSIAVLFAVLLMAYVIEWAMFTTYPPLLGKIVSNYQQAWQGLLSRIEHPNRLKKRYYQSLAKINRQTRFPTLSGTSDLYSDEQTKLFAANNRWSPRPVFQSFCAYTPGLLRLNRDFLLTERMPENIFFRVGPIDHRYPTLMDDASWPIILSNYRFVKQLPDYALLKKKRKINFPAYYLQPIRRETHALGERVRVPQIHGILFATVKIKPSVVGKLVNLALKGRPLFMEVTLLNGVTKKYRIVPGMAEMGFLLSPLIETNRDFAALFDQDNKYLNHNVKVIRIVPKYHFFRFCWQPHYSIEFSRFKVS